MFYEKSVILGFLGTNHHGQSSIVAQSESYNVQFRFSPATEFCREFLRKHRDKHLNLVVDINDATEDEEDQDVCKEFKKTFFWESSRKTLASVI